MQALWLLCVFGLGRANRGAIWQVDEQGVVLMNSRELNALVAEKVMGHEFCPIHHGYFCCGRGAHYSTSIADAWMVVEKFIVWDVGTDGCLYLCKIKTHPNQKGYIASADTAPEAICKAALKVVDG